MHRRLAGQILDERQQDSNQQSETGCLIEEWSSNRSSPSRNNQT